MNSSPSRTKIRYVIVGGATFLIELAVLFTAQAAGVPGTGAVALSFIVGLAVSFLLQKVITFQDTQFRTKLVWRQALLYAALVVFNFSFAVCAVWLLERYFPAALIRTATLAVTVIWNYYIYKIRIFRQK